MTFRRWLVETHLESPGALGDLARDVDQDEAAAARVLNTKRAWLAHLTGASEGVLETFEQAWAVYEKAVKREAVSSGETLACSAIPRPRTSIRHSEK